MTLQFSPFRVEINIPAGELMAVACPFCHAALGVASDLFGKPAACPLCEKRFLIPLPTVAPLAPVPDLAPPVTVATAAPVAPVSDLWSGVTTDAEVSLQTSLTPREPAATGEGELDFKEPIRTVGHGDKAIELHCLTPEEKTARRSRRSIITLLLGVSILMTIVLLLGTKRK